MKTETNHREDVRQERGAIASPPPPTATGVVCHKTVGDYVTRVTEHTHQVLNACGYDEPNNKDRRGSQ